MHASGGERSDRRLARARETLASGRGQARQRAPLGLQLASFAEHGEESTSAVGERCTTSVTRYPSCRFSKARRPYATAQNAVVAREPCQGPTRAPDTPPICAHTTGSREGAWWLKYEIQHRRLRMARRSPVPLSRRGVATSEVGPALTSVIHPTSRARLDPRQGRDARRTAPSCSADPLATSDSSVPRTAHKASTT
jgi:hypothetical protein